MSKYEGLVIFPETMKDDALETVIGQVKAEVERQEGVVENVTRMGRKPFARPVRKLAGGHYVVFNLTMDGRRLADLNARLKLNDEVIRSQFTRLPDDAQLKTPRIPRTPRAERTDSMGMENSDGLV